MVKKDTVGMGRSGLYPRDNARLYIACGRVGQAHRIDWLEDIGGPFGGSGENEYYLKVSSMHK